jgi:hypothetical protein
LAVAGLARLVAGVGAAAEFDQGADPIGEVDARQRLGREVVARMAGIIP